MGRRTLLAATLVAAACAATGALAAPPKPVEGAPFTWLIQPGHMRRSAIAHDLGTPLGWAEVECVINRKRRPDNCVVIASEPAGGRIERFVTAIAREHVAAKTDKAGQPVEGRRVRFAAGIGNYVIP